jgi:predicted Zn-ribbon and HTH transcriptional regulator
MIVYVLNCYKKLSNKKYKRDFYVGEVKNAQKLAYRLRNHYLGRSSFLGRENYGFIDLGHLYEPEEELDFDLEKAFINLSAWNLREIIEFVGLENEYKIDIHGQDCSEYLNFQDKGFSHHINIKQQFWNDNPEMIGKLGVVINRSKNEFGKKLNAKCDDCGFEFKATFEGNVETCPRCDGLCEWLYDWAVMLNDI